MSHNFAIGDRVKIVDAWDPCDQEYYLCILNQEGILGILLCDKGRERWMVKINGDTWLCSESQFEFVPQMPDPDMSLDEIFQAKEIYAKMEG